MAHEEICVAHNRGREKSRKIDYEQSPCDAFKGSFHSFGFTHQPHEHVILFLRMNDNISTRDVGRRTGLSSQFSPNSSIFAKRSSTIALINSSCFRICDGRLDITRTTILALIQRYGLMTRCGNIRPEWCREHSEDCRIFYDIKRQVQIQIQIVLISAYETLIEIQC